MGKSFFGQKRYHPREDIRAKTQRRRRCVSTQIELEIQRSPSVEGCGFFQSCHPAAKETRRDTQKRVKSSSGAIA